MRRDDDLLERAAPLAQDALQTRCRDGDGVDPARFPPAADVAPVPRRVVYCGTIGMGHAVGDPPELRTSGAGSLLAWEAISFCSSVTQRFDFEGSMSRRWSGSFGRSAPIRCRTCG